MPSAKDNAILDRMCERILRRRPELRLLMGPKLEFLPGFGFDPPQLPYDAGNRTVQGEVLAVLEPGGEDLTLEDVLPPVGDFHEMETPDEGTVPRPALPEVTVDWENFDETDLSLSGDELLGSEEEEIDWDAPIAVHSETDSDFLLDLEEGEKEKPAETPVSVLLVVVAYLSISLGAMLIYPSFVVGMAVGALTTGLMWWRSRK